MILVLPVVFETEKLQMEQQQQLQQRQVRLKRHSPLFAVRSSSRTASQLSGVGRALEI